MKITKSIIDNILDLEQEGVSHEVIEKVLGLKGTVFEVKEKFESYQNMISVQEATSLLKPHLKELKDDRAYELKVLRLISKGEIVAEKPSNKEGYRISRDEIDRFIKESKMTKNDWRKRAIELQVELNELKKQLSEKAVAPALTEEVPVVPKGQLTIEKDSDNQIPTTPKKNPKKAASGTPTKTIKETKDKKTVDKVKKETKN